MTESAVAIVLGLVGQVVVFGGLIWGLATKLARLDGLPGKVNRLELQQAAIMERLRIPQVPVD